MVVAGLAWVTTALVGVQEKEKSSSIKTIEIAENARISYMNIGLNLF